MTSRGTWRAAGRAVAALVATAALAACGAEDAGRDAPGSTAPDYAEADVVFARAMIPHGQQGADMSELVLEEKGLEPGVRALATEIRENQPVETEQLEQWVAEHGEPVAHEAAHDHGGGEDGIATPDQMYALDEATGPAAQDLYVEMMIKHHRGAVVAAQDEVAEGKSPALVELAGTVLRSREAQLTVLLEAAG